MTDRRRWSTRRLAVATGLVVAALALVRLLIPTAVGRSDQGDGQDLLCQLDVRASLGWNDSPSAYVPFRWDAHQWASDACERAPSTQLTLLRAAKGITPLFGFEGTLDLRALGIVCALLLGGLAAALVMVLPGRPAVRVGIVALLVASVLDSGVAGVFISGYSQPAAILGLLAVLAAALAVLGQERAAAASLLALAGAGAFAVMASPDLVAIVPVLVAGLVWRPRSATSSRTPWLGGRRLGLLLAVGLVGLSAWFVRVQPADQTAALRHEQVFFTMLPLGGDAEADLRWLGLDPKLADAEGTAFGQDPAIEGTDAYGEVAELGRAELARFWVMHPGRLALLGRRGLDAAASYRLPPYLASYGESSGEPEYASENRIWLTSLYFEIADAVPAVLVVTLAGVLFISRGVLRRSQAAAVRGPALVTCGLVLAAIAEFWSVLLLHGMVETTRHLLVFNLLVFWSVPVAVAALLGARRPAAKPAVPPDLAERTPAGAGSDAGRACEPMAAARPESSAEAAPTTDVDWLGASGDEFLAALRTGRASPKNPGEPPEPGGRP